MNEKPLPRWRGFNLLEMFSPSSNGDFKEDDFRWITDWGFDFVRLPLCYWLWIGVHCGEGGAYNKTPHAVVLRWWEDVADILGRAGIGWALWNFRGPFGVLDSGRGDVPYVDWHGHALDAEFLRRLQAS